jgi:heme exporter protein C
MARHRIPLGSLIGVTGVVVAAALYAAFLYAPTERTMGDVQRIFYFHVAAGMLGLITFLAVFAGCILYLATRDARWDRLAEASAEIGLLFTTIVLITGPIWAKPVWGIWWTWDARLTSTLVLWFIYWAYLLIRAYVAHPARRAALSSVVGILGALDVPIVYFSIRWWRTQHPAPVIGGAEGSGLAPPMRHAFLAAIAAYVCLYVVLAVLRTRFAKSEEEVDALAREVRDVADTGAARAPRAAERSST